MVWTDSLEAVTLKAVTCCTVTARLSLVPATPKQEGEQCTARASSDSAWPLSMFSCQQKDILFQIILSEAIRLA